MPWKDGNEPEELYTTERVTHGERRERRACKPIHSHVTAVEAAAATDMDLESERAPNRERDEDAKSI